MNRKGLDAVVTTLLIILLVLVAVGIIWVVVRNVVQQGSEQIDVSAKCLAVDLRAVSVNDGSTDGNLTNYTVTLKRAAGGEALGGIKVTLFNDTANSGVIDFGAAIAELETTTKTIVGVTNANKIEYTAYFIDSSGNEQPCSQTGAFNF